ncbi:ATP-dependent helicase HrpB [Alkalilimnicola ehrlichii]|uniref:ATP-dependent helicase HrpB n=1 Tax=Alkalilimnicola ehrlichii TaxID=351052 RepID=A0A3E0WJ57_9GAMM|nr:ATP-dependent helicase HrpB [Alkalilimnicola ehrlichii]RFA24501.1 ATP-dependent helicase HrpB [Alkalilimnicola ehrlichii]RFA32181.1 ATP-dependent helicase HrpB [Alkalilimnicola ehrlichii]
MSLPIDDVLPKLLSALRHRSAAVLQAPPGAGKTTRVPLALLNEPWLTDKRIIMLEPRRLAARSAARYMARQLGTEPGATVGYRTRLDSRIGAETRIEVVTEGILTRLIQDDPELSRYGCILFDEFHERSLQADLGLALCLEVQQALRPDLKLVVMSATLDGEPVARLLGDAPLVTSEGRSFPVTKRYRPAGQAPLEQHVAATVREALAEDTGSILVFLPGTGEIRRVERLLAAHLPADVQLAPLYGDLSPAAQDAAIAPAAGGQRKIVLATAIAETSLTIEGIRIVIDAGLMRRARFDPNSGLSRLVTSRASQAAAEQRAGRAGRLEPGVCYRLWSEAEHSRLAPFSPPEIADADLSDAVLELAQWGTVDPDELPWLTPPPAAAWQQAQHQLQRLGALDNDGRITAHGRTLARLGLPPRLAHMVRAGEARGWHGLACRMAALLVERDVLGPSAGSDLRDRLAHLDAAPAAGAGKRIRQSAQQLRRRLQGEEGAAPDYAAGLLLAFAYPDRIAQRRPGPSPRFRLANGRGAWLAEDDPLREAPLLVAAALDGQAREARIFLAAELPLAVFEAEFGEHLTEAEFVAWDANQEAVLARRQRRYEALVLADAPLPAPSPEAVAAALCEGIRRKGLDCLPWEKAHRQWQARVEWLRKLEGDGWPEVSDEALLARLDEWALPFLAGYTRLAQLKQFPLQEALTALLDYSQQQRLERQAPARIEVPSGSRIAIDYTAEVAPVLAVRLQELFGWHETPTIADGRIRLMLHLLSPAQRPMQVTQDLGGFWRDTYHQVRKDLRGRYPKHPWPEDPLSAQAPQRRRKS